MCSAWARVSRAWSWLWRSWEPFWKTSLKGAAISAACGTQTGAHGVVIPRRGGVGVSGTVMKASAGAAARLPVARVPNMAQAVRTLKENNVFVYCADMGGEPLERTDLSGAVALVMGSEGSGVSALVRKLCDGIVSLDMAARGTGVDSYNVSVAAGILMYDVMRRRNG